MNERLFESLEGDMKDVADEFDSLCRELGYEYAVGTDEYNEQSYKIEKHFDATEIIKHMENYIDGLAVTMEFDKDKYGTNFIFRIKSLSEEEMNEDQYKGPTRKHIRDQSAFPSSLSPSRTFGGRGDEKDNDGRVYEFDEEDDDPTSVTEGYINNLNECMTTFVEPDILFTVGVGIETPAGPPPGPNPDQIKQEVQEYICALRETIEQFNDVYPEWNDVKRAVDDLSRKVENISVEEPYTSLEQHIDQVIDSELL